MAKAQWRKHSTRLEGKAEPSGCRRKRKGENSRGLEAAGRLKAEE